MTQKHPVDNLVRLNCGAPISLRAKAFDDDGEASGDGNTIFGHFSVFNTWTEIHSWFEGDFLERIAPGAFKRSFADKSAQIRMLYEHGHDPQIGNKPIGRFDVLKEDSQGAYYEGELFDAEYAQQLKPALRAGQLGASFRFSVTAEEWVDPEKATEWNPAKLPERTITGVDLMEAGPVTFGAYPQATAGLRSSTDEFYERLLKDPLFMARFTERVGLKVAEKVLTSAAADGPAADANAAADGPKAAQRGRLVASVRTQLLALEAIK